MSAYPREPFDADEAAAADAYRALPGGEPSAELDARILAQARTALIRPRRRRPWFLGAGMGAAAAAVMAAGIAWQIGWLGGVPGGQSESQTRPARTQPAGRDAEESISVDLIGVKDQRKVAEAATAESLPPQAPPAPPPPAAAAAPPSAPPPPRPAPEPAKQELSQPAPAAISDRAPEPFPAEEDKADAALDDGAATELSGERRRRDEEREAASGAALGVMSKRAQALGPWTEDEALEPDAWIERIRERVRTGDRQGAEYSLQRFMLKHPSRTVPRELQRLLVE